MLRNLGRLLILDFSRCPNNPVSSTTTIMMMMMVVVVRMMMMMMMATEKKMVIDDRDNVGGDDIGRYQTEIRSQR